MPIALPHGQQWLIAQMRSLGYLSTKEGIDFGLAYIGMQFILVDDIDSFHQQLLQIYQTKNLKKNINQVREKKSILLQQATQYVLQGMALRLNKTWDEIWENLSEMEKKRLLNYVWQLIENKLSVEEHKILAILPFFDSIELHHQTYLHPHLFEEKDHSCVQESEPQEQGEVTTIGQFTGTYNQRELITYLNTLHQALCSSAHSVGFILDNGYHTITLGWNVTQDCWILVDPKTLSHKKIYCDSEAAAEIMTIFSSNNIAIFATSVYTTHQYAEIVRAQFSSCLAQKKWQQIHIPAINKTQRLSSTSTTWLYVAARIGHVDTVTLLLQCGAAPNLVQKDGRTALSIATQFGHTNVVKVLLQYGADINQHGKKTATALYIAAKQGHAEIVKLLMQCGADPNIPFKENTTALSIATEQGHAKIVELLLQFRHFRTNANLARSNGATPLAIAAYYGQVRIVELLLKNNADPTLELHDGKTPLRIATQRGHLHIAKLLQQAIQERKVKNTRVVAMRSKAKTKPLPSLTLPSRKQHGRRGE